MIKHRLRNMTLFSVNRFFIKKIIQLNGIKNVLIVMKNNDYFKNVYTVDKNCIIINSNSDLQKFELSNRLKTVPSETYFSNGSTLFIIVKGRKIVSYTWLHDNFDPNGDIKSIGINNYYIVGPSFVEKKHRGKGFNRAIKKMVYSFCKEKAIYAVMSFDNLPIIMNNHREGFKLSNVIIRTTKSEMVL